MPSSRKVVQNLVRIYSFLGPKLQGKGASKISDPISQITLTFNRISLRVEKKEERNDSK